VGGNQFFTVLVFDSESDIDSDLPAINDSAIAEVGPNIGDVEPGVAAYLVGRCVEGDLDGLFDSF